MVDRTIFDAIPIPIFVMGPDTEILDLNAAAASFTGKTRETAYRRRGGDVLHCLHSNDVAEGCGWGPVCADCLIRDSIRQCLEGHTVSRRRVNLQRIPEQGNRDLQVLITVCPLGNDGADAVLLMIEDVTELSNLKSLVPICARCKRVRDDRQYWQSLEVYFAHHAGVDFSHGLCPTCAKELYPDLKQ